MSSDADRVSEMMRRMLRIRVLETELESAYYRGEILGSLHSSIGQEATAVGACMALSDDDYVAGNHRSHGHPVAKGASLRGIAAEMFGRRTGSCKGLGGSMHLADFSVGSIGEAGIVASTIPIATGAALASKTLGNGRVCLSFFGDGAVNAGPFHESLNLASVWKLPVVFVCENNLLGAMTRFEKTSAVADVADRAAAYAIPGTIVDGQDVVAVYEAVVEAVVRARGGNGPTLIEAKTYRFRDHSTTTLAQQQGERDPDELAAWLARDPITLLRERMLAEQLVTEAELASLEGDATDEMADALEFARSSEPTTIDDLLNSMYVDPTGMFTLGGSAR